jgi:hypothetical protein
MILHIRAGLFDTKGEKTSSGYVAKLYCKLEFVKMSLYISILQLPASCASPEDSWTTLVSATYSPYVFIPSNIHDPTTALSTPHSRQSVVGNMQQITGKE